MQIPGTTNVHNPHGIQGPHTPRRSPSPNQAPPAPQASDQLDISPAAEAAVQATEGAEIRQPLVDQIRAQIADGTYETPEKIDQALDRLLDEVG